LAQGFYNDTISQPRPNPLNFHDWKILITAKFPIGRDAALRELELVHRIQKPTESVSDYAVSIRTLAKTSYLTLPSQQREIIAKGAFLRGLRPAIKRFTLIGPDPVDLDEAIKIATQEEIQSDLFGAQLNHLIQTSSLEQAINALSTDLSKFRLSNSPTPGLAAPTYRPIGRGRGQVSRAMFANTANRCWTCNRVGHYALACPQKHTVPSIGIRSPVGYRVGNVQRGRGRRPPGPNPQRGFPSNLGRMVGTLGKGPTVSNFHPGLDDDVLLNNNISCTDAVLNVFQAFPMDYLTIPSAAEFSAGWKALEALMDLYDEQELSH